MALNAEEALELVETFAGGYPEAYRLAVVASLAVRIEPELVRALRRLLPGVDAGAEADLWFSPLTRSQTPLAMEFWPGVVEPLRRKLADDQNLLRATWELLDVFHAKAPRALRLEEELTWLALSSESNQELIEERLRSVAAALRGGQRKGLARWARRALPALPAEALANEAARHLSFVAGMQTGVGPLLETLPRRALTEEELRQYTAKDLGNILVGLRLFKQEEEVVQEVLISGPTVAPSLLHAPAATPDATPMLVELSQPPAPSAEQIEVPDTYRLLFEVSWGEGEGRQLRRLSLYPDETRAVKVGYGEVTIRTALGDLNTLRPRFEFDLLLIYERSEAEFVARLSERLAQQDWRGKRISFDTLVLDHDVNEDGIAQLESNFDLSRKIGFVVPRATAAQVWPLEALWPSRPEPSHLRDWLVPIKAGTGGVPNFYGASPTADFGAGFEEGFRSLWQTLTGEILLLPDPVEQPKATEPLKVFISYSHKDERMLDELSKHLALLRREGIIGSWHDRKITAGERWTDKINDQLTNADLILLLVSPDFLASDYVFDVEVAEAMKRHEAGDARVVPIILRPCDWISAPFGKLQALPKDARPITRWKLRDEAFMNVADGVRRIAEELRAKRDGTLDSSRAIPLPPLVGFVPRRDENGRDFVERLRAELVPGGNQTVVLWGAGGVGKTTLAAEAARALEEAFGAGRVVWTSASGRVDYSFSTLLDDAAAQLGRPELRLLVSDEKVKGGLALLSEAPTLIILDNFEMMPPNERQMCVEFFASEVRCSVLITSRQRIEKARTVPVSAMSLDEAQDFLARLINVTENPRVFTTTMRRRIAEVAESNPLIMQWVVAQIDAAQEPEAVFAQLARGEGEAADRVFDRTFDLPQLSDDGRSILLALALFSPSASREALAIVAGFDEDESRMGEALKRLYDLWLLETTAESSRISVTGLTRALAGGRLSKDARAVEYRQRFVSYFEYLANAHAVPTPENFETLEAEKDNLIGAADAAFEMENWDAVQQIAFNLVDNGGLFIVRGYWDEANRVSRQALEAARRSERKERVAWFAANLAFISKGRGDLRESEQLLTEAIDMHREVRNVGGEAAITVELASVKQLMGDFKYARELNEQSLKQYESVEDRSVRVRGRARVFYQLGNLALEQQNLEEGTKFLYESLSMAQELGDLTLVANIKNRLGTVAAAQGETSRARSLYEESLETQKKLGNQLGVANSIVQLGSLAGEQGDLSEAQRLLQESLTIYRRLGYEQGVAESLNLLGRLAEQEGDRTEAARLYRESLRIYEKLGSHEAEDVRRSLASLESPSE